VKVKVKCPNAECRKVLVVDTALAGKKGKCSTCGAVFKIPAVQQPSGGKSDPGVARPASGGSPAARPKPGASGSGSHRVPPSQSPQKPARRPSAREEEVDEVEWIDAEEIEDVEDFEAAAAEDYEEDYEAEPTPRPSRGGQRSGPRGGGQRGTARSRQPDEDEYEDYDPPEDDFDDYGPPRRGGGRSRRASKKVGGTGLMRRAGVGVILLTIGTCVTAAVASFSGLAFAMMPLAAVTRSEGLRDVLVALGAITGYFGLLIPIAWVLAIIGYSFTMQAPDRNGSKGLSIASLAVSGFRTLLLLYVFVDAFSGGFARSLSFLSPGRSAAAGYAMILIGVLLYVEMILLPILTAALNRQLGDRHNEDSANKCRVLAVAFGATAIVGTGVMYGLNRAIVRTASPTSYEEARSLVEVLMWVNWLFYMGVVALGVTYFVKMVLTLINTQRAIP
jgi:hypothetical protein